MTDTWIWYIIAAVLFIYSLYRLWQIVSYTLRRSASKNWPVTSGKVIDKQISSKSGNIKVGSSFNPRFTYSYTVLGSEYKKTISLGSRWSRRGAEDSLEKAGDTVDVRYNPLKPGENFIDDERNSANDILTVLVLWLIILFFLYSFYASGELRLGTR